MRTAGLPYEAATAASLDPVRVCHGRTGDAAASRQALEKSYGTLSIRPCPIRRHGVGRFATR